MIESLQELHDIIVEATEDAMRILEGEGCDLKKITKEAKRTWFKNILLWAGEVENFGGLIQTLAGTIRKLEEIEREDKIHDFLGKADYSEINMREGCPERRLLNGIPTGEWTVTDVIDASNVDWMEEI